MAVRLGLAEQVAEIEEMLMGGGAFGEGGPSCSEGQGD
jgi:hypothetical protein